MVRGLVSSILESEPAPQRVVSLCAGDGRDLVPYLAPTTRALLVESDPPLAEAARRSASGRGLTRTTVRTVDAGHTRHYADHLPADLLLLCGVFGNVTDHDVAAAVAALPSLLSPGGVVVWTRGARPAPDPAAPGEDPAQRVRGLLGEAGLEEEAFVQPDDASFRVGVHRLAVTPEPHVPLRLFTFV